MRTPTWAKFLILLVSFAMLAAACGDGDGSDTGTTSESCDLEDLNLVTAGVLTVATGDPAFPLGGGIPASPLAVGSVPEPGTLPLAVLGAVSAFAVGWRRRRSTS